ncbi:MAG TPA: DUF6356 family protein [Gammaproteobacteria bacterium]|nr:DUF6356 family protein [Gammaproteobacteria bacterium]
MLGRHLKEINQGYFCHLKGALGYACRCFVASLCLFIHALFPFVLENKGGDIIRSIDQQIRKNNNKY